MRDNFVKRAATAQSVVRSSPRQPVNSPMDRPQAAKQRSRQLHKELQQQSSTETLASVAKLEENSLLLQGKSVIFSETDKPITMETIPEEQSLSTLSPKPSIPERNTPTALGSQKEVKILLTNTEQGYSSDLVRNEQDTQLTPLSAKVMLKNQISQSEQQETIPTSGKGKRSAVSCISSM